mmetsp:Transcript_74148/g.196772  ORF Transcript_74148/g.196772 Transcript_74148/m.196772 type:complete len:231 (-) Transcript_74148:11-703(-)
MARRIAFGAAAGEQQPAHVVAALSPGALCQHIQDAAQEKVVRRLHLLSQPGPQQLRADVSGQRGQGPDVVLSVREQAGGGPAIQEEHLVEVGGVVGELQLPLVLRHGVCRVGVQHVLDDVGVSVNSSRGQLLRQVPTIIGSHFCVEDLGEEQVAGSSVHVQLRNEEIPVPEQLPIVEQVLRAKVLQRLLESVLVGRVVYGRVQVGYHPPVRRPLTRLCVTEVAVHRQRSR